MPRSPLNLLMQLGDTALRMGTDHDHQNHPDHSNPAQDSSLDATSTPHQMTHGGGHEGMSPFLFTRTKGFFVLFMEANIQSTGAFIAALILSALFALLATVISQVARVYENKALNSGKFVLKLAGAVLHAFRQLLHYVAMLIVMTMNVWIILAVVAGHGLGWLVYAFVLNSKFSMTDEDGKPKGMGFDC